MNYSLKTRVLSMLLALVMVIGLLPMTALATEADSTEPEATVSETTVPETTVSETTVPETTVPETTIPETTIPETTVPETTVPETTVPETTVPETTVPETTVPETTAPEDEDAGVALASEEASPYSLTIASSTVSNLAPGVTETSIVAYDSNGDRVQYFVVNANIATDSTVQVKANYQNNDNTGNWGKATVVEQANAAKEKRGYNVVASTNASYYNVSTGQPTGGFVMEGVNINGDAMGNQYEFFAIMKDGTAMIGKRGTFSQYSANIQEAVAGHLLLVWDGKVVEGLNSTSKYPRSTVGVKANGDVILMLADGNNKPYSAGLTYAEQAQLMLELGCVAAVELDGGGSATYAAKLEGSDEIEVRNVCCDGTVRSVSNTLMVISTAVADGTFDHANLSTEYAYYAPNSTVEINAVPVDAAGGAAEMPEGATWTLSDDSFGTIADGVFTSTGKTGTVAAQVVSDGNVVGSVDVTIVNPTSIAFSADEKTVPYGKTSDFTITAMYNGAEMYAAADAYEFAVSAGSMDGFIYTAPSDDSASATVTATYKYATMDAITVNVSFGKGSEILVDFESGDISDWVEINGLKAAAENGTYAGGFTDASNTSAASNHIAVGLQENVFLASRANGDPVYSGDYALGYTMDYTQSTSHANWQYAYLYYLGDLMTYRDVDKGINGTRLGMWMYIPEEAVGLCARLAYTYEQGDGTLNTAYLYFTYQYVTKGFSKLTSEVIPEAGWAYVYCDLDDISTTYVTSSYYKDENGNTTRDPYTNYAPAFIQFIVSSSATGAEKCTVYIDDITLDYSDVVDDRDTPIISNPVALDDLNSYAMGSTLSFNTVSFTADVAEDTSHGTNFTGLDASTAQIYVDGQAVATSYSAGKIAATGVVLPNGTHDVTFEIADKQGNYTKLTKQIVIAAETEYPVITLTGSAPAVNANGNLYTGAQYNLMLNTDKVEAIDTVTTQIWLNSASKWSLQNMTVLPGFEVSYTLDELACTAAIAVKRVGEVETTGEATLVTIPVYAWSWDGSAGHDATYQWNTEGCAPQITVSFDVKYGAVSYTDEYSVSDAKYLAGFGSARSDVWTELNSSIANLKNTIGIWHSHSAEAIDDVAATCTTDGYTGRTVCSVCKSVVNWGTTSPATGHTYELTEGVLKCHCGELFTGTWTDGKDYVDGVAVSDGWNGDYYYKDGVYLTGIQLIDGLYYDLGEDGVNKGKCNGLLELDDGLYYAILGELQGGWQYDAAEDAYYFFSRVTKKALNGVVKIDGHTYEFEDYKLVTGELVKDAKGIKYYWAGALIANGWTEIKGDTYYFRNGYAYTGIKSVETSRFSGEYLYYLFDENGVMLNMLNGFHEGVYYQEGKKIPYLGLIEYEGNYYYISDNAEPVKDKTYFVTKTNGLTYANGVEIKKGSYAFDAEGKVVMREGLIDGYYYENNVKVTYAGLIEHEGNFYYISDHAAPIKNKTYFITKTNGLTYENGVAIKTGSYTFDADGKMVMREGLIDGYYYENNVKVTYAGLIEHEGNFYYISDHAAPIKNKTYFITKTNDLTYENGTVIKKGSYTFDEQGRMVMRNGLIDGYYFVDNVKVSYAGLIEQDGAFYYISDNAKPVAGKSYFITKTNGLTYNGEAIAKGRYEFDETGKMILE